MIIVIASIPRERHKLKPNRSSNHRNKSKKAGESGTVSHSFPETLVPPYYPGVGFYEFCSIRKVKQKALRVASSLGLERLSAVLGTQKAHKHRHFIGISLPCWPSL